MTYIAIVYIKKYSIYQNWKCYKKEKKKNSNLELWLDWCTCIFHKLNSCDQETGFCNYIWLFKQVDFLCLIVNVNIILVEKEDGKSRTILQGLSGQAPGKSMRRVLPNMEKLPRTYKESNSFYTIIIIFCSPPLSILPLIFLLFPFNTGGQTNHIITN